MAIGTEQLLIGESSIDARPVAEAVAFMVDNQVAAVRSVANASDTLIHGALAMANSIRSGRVLYYTAAGSSGLMAATDAMELGGTFNISDKQVRILMAGGLPDSALMPGDTEDDIDGLNAELAEIQSSDTMIAVSASGTTPYTLGAVSIAKAAGATIIGVANNANCPLLSLVDFPVFLNTPSEVLAGSTRLGAGSAQKVALNTLSTLMATHLGHIYQGMMVNVRIDNRKLRNRACRIVSTIANVTEDEAGPFIDKAQGNVKVAVLLAAGASSLDSAQLLLNDSQGQLNAALSRLNI